MSFMQKQRENKLRKDVLERADNLPEEESDAAPKRNRVVVTKGDSGSISQMFWVEGHEESNTSNPHLDSILQRLIAKRADEEAEAVEESPSK